MALLDKTSYFVTVIIAAILLTSSPTSIAYELPVHNVVLSFAACGLALLSLDKALPSFFRPLQDETNHVPFPLEDRGQPHSSHDSSPMSQGKRHGLSPRLWKGILLAVILALILRVELYRRISKATECTISSVEVFLPFLVSIYDSVRFQKVILHDLDSGFESSGHAQVNRELSRSVFRHSFRYIPSAFLLSFGSYLLSGIWTGTNSTYICPLVVGETRTIPQMQILAVLLDCFVLASVVELSLPRRNRTGWTGIKGPTIWASVLMTTAMTWSLISLIVFFMKPHYRHWLLPLELVWSLDFIKASIVQVFLISVFCISTLHCMLGYGLLYVTMNLTTLCVLVPALQFLWSNQGPFPPTSMTAGAVPIMFIYLGWWSFGHVRQSVGLDKKISPLGQASIFIFLLILAYPVWSRTSQLALHPIDILLPNAQLQHEQYFEAACKSNSLQEAVVEYRRKYSMSPPPGFDIWYEYVTNSTTTIIDEFDQIYNDLLPFRLTSPEDLRRQTWEMISNPWNEISGIFIRGGVATVQEKVLPTHRWLLEGVAILINSFARHLPDMDLAFNLNDESRIAVPFAEISRLRDQVQHVLLNGSVSWSSNRSGGWVPISEQDITRTVFQDMSFRNTFWKYGSIGCDPKSKARKSPHTPSQSHLCTSCAEPHSVGQFLANWSLAGDICHQPDLARLHGFYMSPAAFKTSYQLMPVFSQSKPHGYNDILYPSAWNYMDKAIYAPQEPSGQVGTDSYQSGFPDLDFSQKENTLFWRGSTSEGVSSGDHSWRGMTRQRLVHMVNNLTSASHDQMTVLLPDPASGGDKYRYQNFPGTAIKNLGLNIDIAIVDRIARCGGIGLHDCTDQEKEFDLVPPTEFQSHWKYRFLFDLDGAAFSGRFLPFLQSKSLPFKTALFREWYDSRLTAWRDFVPLDLRLHGLWSTMAYFAGVNATVGGRKVFMEPHLKEAEMIASDGREWAGKVLRKEDMEIYFFRLLLEWGRLTDDNRDNLGFSL